MIEIEGGGRSMKQSDTEPGVLNLFRLFLVIQLVLIYINVGAHSARGFLQGCPWCAVAFGTGSILGLLGYLTLPWLQKSLGKWHLPAGLVLTAVISLIAQNFFLYFREPSGATGSEETAWQLFLFLFIPLVLTGWQYDFKAVVAYCLFTAVLDYTFMRFGREDFALFEDTYRRLIFIRTLSFLIVGYILSQIVASMRQQRTALERANRKLVHYAATLEQLATSQERNRLGRELHDTLAHTLSGLAVQLEGVKSLWDTDPSAASQMLEKSLQVTRSGLKETRQAIQALRATPIEDLGISLAVRELAENAAARAGFTLQLEIDKDLGEISPAIEQCLYRITQEALENIVRHAQARIVHLKLGAGDGRLILGIGDDGVGFDLAAVDRESHYGLRGICERAELVNGDFRLQSQPGKGTSIQLIIRKNRAEGY
jgi:signal transduction histidine kinase